MAETSNTYGNRPVGTNWSKDWEAASVWVTKGKGTNVIHFVGLSEDAIVNIINNMTVDTESDVNFGPQEGMDFLYCTYREMPDSGEIDFQVVVEENGGIERFLNEGWTTMQNSIIESGVDPKLVEPLTYEIESATHSISPAEQKKMISVANQSYAQLWQQYLNEIDSPEMQDVLSVYSKMYGNTTYGHVLSLRNIMLAKAQKPDATYVLTRNVWREAGRGVLPNAQPIYLFRRKSQFKYTDDDVKTALKQLGHDPNSFSKQGFSVQNAAKNLADRNTSNMLRFIWYIGYDISDTFRLDEDAEDTMISMPGITSNLAYILNQKAEEAEAERNAENKKTEGDLGARKNEMDERTAIALEVVEALCKSKKVKFTSRNEDPHFRLVEALRAYYNSFDLASTSTLNIVKPNLQKDAVEKCVKLTMLMTRTGFNAIPNSAIGTKFSDAEGMHYGNLISHVVSAINGEIADRQHQNTQKNYEYNASWDEYEASQQAAKQAEDDELEKLANGPILVPFRGTVINPDGSESLKQIGTTVGSLRGMDRKEKKAQRQQQQQSQPKKKTSKKKTNKSTTVKKAASQPSTTDVKPGDNVTNECKMIKENFYRIFDKINQQLF